MIITGLPYPPRMDPKVGGLAALFSTSLHWIVLLLWPADRSEDAVFGRGPEETLNSTIVLYYKVIRDGYYRLRRFVKFTKVPEVYLPELSVITSKSIHPLQLNGQHRPN